MTKRKDYLQMVPIDLKKLGRLPYSEMDARALAHPEHEGYIEIIIPIFEEEAVRVVSELKLERKLKWSNPPEVYVRDDMPKSVSPKESVGERT